MPQLSLQLLHLGVSVGDAALPGPLPPQNLGQLCGVFVRLRLNQVTQCRGQVGAAPYPVMTLSLCVMGGVITPVALVSATREDNDRRIAASK